ncbi:anti-sigma factor [Bacillus phage SPG24]|uniref:anti-sigma factor n=1 Tax=Bacillus phage SPG24 TaxID=1497851 RepID=UPI0022BA2864|nr:anti-sigma factor [Bacillus phage SPG24]
MKLTVDHAVDMLLLEVETTGEEKKHIYLSTENVHYWYPLNTNFSYRYSNAKEQLYLVQEGGYTGDNVYGADILKRSKQLVVNKDGFLIHPEVLERNMYIMDEAALMGIPTLAHSYNGYDVEDGFDTLSSWIKERKEIIEGRFMTQDAEAWTITQTELNEEWDTKLYSYATDEELKKLQELGEIYNMLCLMRKLAEGR